MRKHTALPSLLLLAFAVPLLADDRHQSYISFDDGGTIIRQAEDNREVEGRVNLPIYPGDDLVTNRRGRVEIRLSDANVLGVDRDTALNFRSMLDSYEGDSSQTIIELRSGRVIVARTDVGRELVRLDTANASYVASDQAIYVVETDTSTHQDRVGVFDGSVEVRTPSRSTRLRTGEEAKVDERGLYNVSRVSQRGPDDFEAWFLRRAERYNGGSNRYLDRRQSYSASDLDEYGNWTYINSYGWSWRPHVAIGWRPYYNGYWYRGGYGSLAWVSYEPWGWVPYHYGRWAYDSLYGWVWLPGAAYSPAWVYWWYGSGYVGWAPAGWYDAYRPYYNWCYRPYAHYGYGSGFYGRIRVHDIDLRPWTFVDGRTIFSNRVDRAALTTDAIKQRLQRDGGFATVSSNPTRFGRNDIKDPAAAISGIARRGIGSGTGKESPGSSADLTPFFRRDPELSNTIRERIARSRPPVSGGSPSTATAPTGGLAPVGRGGLAPVGGGSLAPIGRGSVAPVGRGEVTPAAPSREQGSGTVNRSGERGARSGEAPSASPGTSWRDRLDRDRKRETVPSAPRDTAPAQPSRRELDPTTPRPETPSSSWRDRVLRGDTPRLETPGSTGDSGAASSTARERPPARSSDVPRRIIDRIGGPRLVPSEDRSRQPASTGSRDSSGSRDSAKPRDSGGSRDRGSVDRSSPPPRSSGGDSDSKKSSPPPARDNGGARREGGASRGEGGKVHRNN